MYLDEYTSILYLLTVLLNCSRFLLVDVIGQVMNDTRKNYKNNVIEREG